MEEYEKSIAGLFQAIQTGEIRIGGNKNRGFGRLSIEGIYQRAFRYQDSQNEFDMEEWRAFKKDAKCLERYGRPVAYADWKDRQEKGIEKYVKIKVPLRLTGGISIRKYSAKPDAADFEHITCNGDSVIPGSSWNGAIRADAKDILLSLGKTQEETDGLMEDWFGMVSKDGKNAKQSMVVVGESIIDPEDSVRMPVMRNQINRFDASTKDGALYSEIACFGGTMTLELMVRKDGQKACRALLGLLSFVIEDIQRGYLAIGGQTAVGRGIFEADNERCVTCNDALIPTDEVEQCRKALYALISEGGKA